MNNYFQSSYKMHLFEHPDNDCQSCHYCTTAVKLAESHAGFAPTGRGERRRLDLIERKSKTGSRSHGVQHFAAV